MKLILNEIKFIQRVTVVACIIILATAGYAVIRLHQSELKRIEGTTQNFAVSIQQALEGVVTGIDIALQSSVDEITERVASGLKPSDEARISKYLDHQKERLPHVAFIRGTDDLGDVVYGSGRPNETVSLADREFFNHLRDHPATGIYIAQPVIGKIAKKPVLTLARRINKSDGSFGGTVYASINVDELSQLLSQIKMQNGGSIALRGQDTKLLVRHVFGSDNPIPLGSAQLALPFMKALEQAPDSGTYVSDSSSVDPVVRTYSYQRSKQYGFLVTVGLPMEQEMASWRRQAQVISALAALLSISVLLLGRHVALSRASLEDMVSTLEISQANLQKNHLKLKHAEELHLSVLENLHLGVVVHAPDSSIIFSNAQAAVLLKLSSDQMLGKTAMDPAWCFVDEQGVPFPQDAYPVIRVIRSHKAFENQVLGVNVPGHDALTWLEVSAFPAFFEDGRLKQVVVNFYEITKRLEAERTSERAGRALRLVTDTNMTLSRAESQTKLLTDVCNVIIEKGGYLMAWVGYAQDGAERLVLPAAHAGVGEGYLEDLNVSWDGASPHGQGITGIALHSGTTQVIQDYENSLSMSPWRETAKKYGFESSIALPFVKKSGDRGALTIYSSRPDAFGPDEVALLEELTANMAHGLDALEERRLRFEAESASRAKANFLANMSHEIRTPLNAITGMAYLIRRDGLTPMQEDKLEKLLKSSKHLLNILNDILDLSKIDAGKLTLAQEHVRVEDIVSNVTSMVLERVHGKQLELRSEMDAFPGNLQGDVTRLQQALLNFATNAVKFTDAGHIVLRARVVEDSPQAMVVRFEVADTGIGIDSVALDRLFTDFEQADNTTTRKYGGTGLGLSITRRLARLMGGDAGVDSVPGQGSCFWFSARLAKGVTNSLVDVVQSAEESIRNIKAQHLGKKVLVAEDDPLNAEIAIILLEEAGLVVEVAEDGLQALEKASTHHYDLILMDMQMPQMDGLEATCRIRQLPTYNHTPIMAVTANAFSEDKERCLTAGMNSFLAKPVKREDLYQEILKLLGSFRGSILSDGALR